MDQFEKQFEDLDIRSQVMDGAMSGATTLSTPQEQVDQLIHQVAEENGLEIMEELAKAQPGTALPAASTSRKEREEEVLNKRYDKVHSFILAVVFLGRLVLYVSFLVELAEWF